MIQALNNENNVKKIEKEVRMNLSTIILFNNFLTIYFFIKSLSSITNANHSMEEAKIAKCNSYY